ncbi:MAG: nucleotidyltransferase domain-containing protein [Candidatus Atribacteria bacterium]|nr:nucleotidyltransferase domain-containing protein [Candidatus Atribacteria bacterium]
MDIFNIGRSKTRKAILQLYFSHPEKKYYLRQLEKKLHFPVQNIRRELINLEKNGMFKREKSGNQVYYFLNRESPVYSDIRNIVSKTIGIENQIKESLSGINDINKAFIFGSFADGTQDSLSDIDILIVGDVNEDTLIEEISRLENKFEREINYHIYGEKEFGERRKEENSFISKILLKPVVFLMGDNENNKRIH